MTLPRTDLDSRPSNVSRLRIVPDTRRPTHAAHPRTDPDSRPTNVSRLTTVPDTRRPTHAAHPTTDPDTRPTNASLSGDRHDLRRAPSTAERRRGRPRGARSSSGPAPGSSDGHHLHANRRRLGPDRTNRHAAGCRTTSRREYQVRAEQRTPSCASQLPRQSPGGSLRRHDVLNRSNRDELRRLLPFGRRHWIWARRQMSRRFVLWNPVGHPRLGDGLFVRCRSYCSRSSSCRKPSLTTTNTPWVSALLHTQGVFICPATSYSPTQSPVQYHRR